MGSLLLFTITLIATQILYKEKRDLSVTTKKYASLSTLSTFLENLKTTFASLGHEHSTSDIIDIDELELITVSDIDAICNTNNEG